MEEAAVRAAVVEGEAEEAGSRRPKLKEMLVSGRIRRDAFRASAIRECRE